MNAKPSRTKLAPTPQFARPIRTLRDHITGAEDAVTLVLVDPSEKWVRRLRSCTRRIEAQLVLLGQIAHLPNYATPARKATLLLGKLRHVTGKVRELDVQRGLLKEPQHFHKVSTRSDSGQFFPEDIHLGRHLGRDIKHLRKTLKQQREAEVRNLIRFLRHRQPPFNNALENLLKALTPAEPLTLTGADLSRLVCDWFQHQLPARAKLHPSPEDLHTIRKSAKVARYIAESSPSSKLQRLARVFEGIQQSGGTWHDVLQLHDVAKHQLGIHSALTKTLAQMTESLVRDYRCKLAHFIPDHLPKLQNRAPRRHP